MLKEYPDLKKVLPAPPRICYKIPKNLRDILVRAKLPPPSGGKFFRHRQGFKRCMHSRCQCCPYTVNTSTHSSLFKKKTWEIQSPVDCNADNCIYDVTYNKVGGPGIACRPECQYVGLPTRNVGANIKPLQNHFSRQRKNQLERS